MKNLGVANNLIDRLANDSRIPFTTEELSRLLGNYQQFTGRAAEQTEEFLAECVDPVLSQYNHLLSGMEQVTLAV